MSEIDDAAQKLASELTPTGFVFERARQIQEQVLPQLEEQKARIDEAIATYKIEMKVLEAAASVLPPDRIPLNPEPVEGDNVVDFQQGGVN